MFAWDPEIAQRLKADLKEALGPDVKDVRFHDAVDADGESVLILFLVVGSALLQDANALSRARKRVSDVFRTKRIGLWPHLRFVTRDDAAQIAS